MAVLRWASLVMCLFGIFCGSSLFAQEKGLNHPEALLVYQDATSVQWANRAGSDRLTYHVDARYPADGVVKWISEKLESKDWKALDHGFLDPKLRSPQKDGWWEYLTEIGTSKKCVHQWTGNWKSGSGDIVYYVLRYEHTGCGTDDLHDLEVFALYMPAAVADAAQRAIEQNKRAHEMK